MDDVRAEGGELLSAADDQVDGASFERLGAGGKEGGVGGWVGYVVRAGRGDAGGGRRAGNGFFEFGMEEEEGSGGL